MLASLGLFTIQNVPIKWEQSWTELEYYQDLQYRMFLLNSELNDVELDFLMIYNTECSY